MTKRWAYLSLSLIVVLGLIACAKPEAPSVAKGQVWTSPSGKKIAVPEEQLNLFLIADITYVIGYWNAPRLVGQQDAIDYLTRYKDGIAGRKDLKVNWRDTRSKIDVAVSAYEEFLAFKPKPIMEFGCGTGEVMQNTPRYNGDQIVLYTCVMAPNTTYPVGYVFSTLPYNPDQHYLTLKYWSQNWDYAKEGRWPREAVLSIRGASGQCSLLPENRRKELYDSVKVEHVGFVETPVVPTDPASSIRKLQDLKADLVWVYSLAVTAPPILEENYKMKAGLKFGMCALMMDPLALTKDPAACEGVIANSSYTPLDQDTEGILLIKKYWEEKFRPTETRSSGYILGWMEMFVMKRAIEEALDRLGSWDLLTGEEIRRQMETWGTTDISGFGRLTYTRTRRAPDETKLYRVENKQWKTASDWIKAEPCVPSPDWLKPLPNPLPNAKP